MVRAFGPSDIFDLGSDYRVVHAILACQKKGIPKYYEAQVPIKGWRPELDEKGNPSKYREVLERALQEKGTLEEAMHHAATAPGIRVGRKSRCKPWQSDEIQELIQKRRLCNTHTERASISKSIQKLSRKLLRKYKNEETEHLLQDFSGLSDLPNILECPISSSGKHQEIDCNIFAKALQQVYEDPDGTISVDYEKIKSIPEFILPELFGAMRKMRNRRGGDKTKVVIEMVKHGGPILHQKLLVYVNEISSTGRVPENWHITMFTMLPKSGNLEYVSNWRPIAILPMLYKLFAKML